MCHLTCLRISPSLQSRSTWIQISSIAGANLSWSVLADQAWDRIYMVGSKGPILPLPRCNLPTPLPSSFTPLIPCLLSYCFPLSLHFLEFTCSGWPCSLCRSSGKASPFPQHFEHDEHDHCHNVFYSMFATVCTSGTHTPPVQWPDQIVPSVDSSLIGNILLTPWSICILKSSSFNRDTLKHHKSWGLTSFISWKFNRMGAWSEMAITVISHVRILD